MLTKFKAIRILASIRHFSSVNAEEIEENISELMQKSLPQQKQTISGAFEQEWATLNDHSKIESFYKKNSQNITMSQQLQIIHKLNKMQTQSTSKTDTQKAVSIQSEIVAKCLVNKAALDVYNTQGLLTALADSKLDTSTLLTQKDMKELESHIITNINEFLKADISTTLAALIRLKYIPQLLIDECLKMNKLTTFQSDGSFILLRQLILQGIVNQKDLYEKLWDRLDQTHQKIFNKRCASIISLIEKFQTLLPEYQNANIKRMQHYINRYCQTIRTVDSSEDLTSQIIWVVNSVKQFKAATNDALAEENLDTSEFYDICQRLMMQRASSFKPGQILNALAMFEDSPEQQKSMVQRVLMEMRSDKYDIRLFSFAQLTKVIEYVATYQPQDLHVFAKYVDQTISQNFFNDETLDQKFASFALLMHTFALHGEMHEGAATFKYLLMLTERFGKQFNEFFQKQLNYHLINVVWTLIYRDTILADEMIRQGRSLSSEDSNPLIPRLLEHLYNFQREVPLTNIEQLELFQIGIWINKQLENGRLPQDFAKVIPAKLFEAAEDRFQDYDQSKFPDVQEDVARRLLDLRVTFHENQKLDKLYRVDIKMDGSDHSIMLVSNSEQLSPGFSGIDRVKSCWLHQEHQDHVKYINVEDWRASSHIEKLKMLSKMTQQKKYY